MVYVGILVVIILIGFFVWTNREDKNQKKEEDMEHDEKPLFHTEEEKEEYGKSMDSHPVNLDDAE